MPPVIGRMCAAESAERERQWKIDGARLSVTGSDAATVYAFAEFRLISRLRLGETHAKSSIRMTQIHPTDRR